MFKKLSAATPIDSDYAYIGTFIDFLERIINILISLWDKLIGSLGSLGDSGDDA